MSKEPTTCMFIDLLFQWYVYWRYVILKDWVGGTFTGTFWEQGPLNGYT